MKSIPIPPIVLFYIGALIAGLIVLWVVLKRLGLIQDRQARKDEREIEKSVSRINQNDYFKPQTWVDASKNKLLTDDMAQNYADEIYHSFKWYNDDEERIYSVFRKLTDKAQISQIAYAYANKWNSDLAGDILNLDDDEIHIIYQIIEKI